MRIEATFLNAGRRKIKPQTLAVVRNGLAGIHVARIQPSAPALRAQVIGMLREIGWSNEVRLDASLGITINGIYEGIGAAVQMGNICRFYADLLKLQTLFSQRQIAAGLYIVAVKELATRMGKNLACYERAVQETLFFRQTITFPVALLGLAQD